MSTLYVENVPEELYEALRKRARTQKRSIAAEVITILEQNVPSARELRERRAWMRQLQKLREQPSPAPGPFPSTEEMVREDRER